MSPDDLATIEQALSALGVSEDAAVSATEALGQLRRRDWAVRVLDVWLKAGRARAITVWDNFTAGVELFDGSELRNDGRKFESATPDAARLAAAQTVFTELPADVRAELGECP